jgi:type II secretory ATPase GspE/PulE/Tfp pilus assembly ATPase PilB-like protein/ActR/RegA family two-component response regulator
MKMNGWIVQAARRAGLTADDDLAIPVDASMEDAWSRVGSSCGVDSQQLAQAIASVFSMEVADLGDAEPTAAKLLSGSVARRLGVFPIRDEDRALVVATSNPVDSEAEQDVAFVSGRVARFTVAPPAQIAAAIESAYSADVAAESLLARVAERFDAMGDVELDWSLDDEEPESISEEETAAGPIVRLTNIVLHEAIFRGASDIHIQPMAGHGLVRFRSDGVLRNGMQMPLMVMTRVISRIKILAQLDITDRLRPQDGRARIVVNGKKYDLRVSTVPTRQAEKAVIRVLDPQGSGTLEETGITEREVTRMRRALSNRDGIVVVTGPTGSGKTTTLYGALREIATEDVNIMTVEDPVEYELPGLTQIQVQHKQGMTFASALRAILRQDPDVIFVGEIRDEETAALAAQASLTGHLVLATLHANDAIGSIRRFLDLGLDIGTVGETLRGALAQRLVRSVCKHCVEPATHPLLPGEEVLAARYGRAPAVRARGCDHCMQQGYLGRLPVTEFMVPTPDLVRMMLEGVPPFELHKQAMADGMVPLLESALDRMSAGETTLEEVDRVIGLPDATASEVESAHPEPAYDFKIDHDDTDVVAAGQSRPDLNGASGATAPVGEPGGRDATVALPMEDSSATSVMSSTPSRPSYSVPSSNGSGSGQMNPPSTSNTSPGEASPDLTVPHVLLVDDDGTTRKIARAVLENNMGFRVSESADGSEAVIRFARGEAFDLMVLDLDMPILGGREVLSTVRGSMATASIPIIVLTGTPDPEAEIELMEAGADDYLRKPIDTARLQTRVRAVLRRAQG